MTSTVTVACKLPHGLVLQLQTMVEREEPVMGGGIRKVKQAVRTGEKILIAGFARPVNPEGEHEFAPLVGGFGLTHDVPADFFDQWLAQNAELDAVKRGFIFAAERSAEVKAQARDHRDHLSGLEPISPSRLPNEFQKIKPAEK